MANDDSGLQDLEREVTKTTTLEHANILKIEGLVRTEGEPPFILMEYVEGAEALQGTDLDQVRRQTPNRLMPWSGVRHYMLQLCDALEYAHNQKIAHRDIKPSNLLINRQAQLKLADFGIAASIAGTASTVTVSVLDAGTPSYMSPQQIEGRQPQAADDIYSLGATFYDLLTGTPPFYLGEVVHQVLNVQPTPMEERLRELGASNDIPDYVGAMVMACLQKDPEKRPVSASAIRKWIESKGKAASISVVKRVVWEEGEQSATARRTPGSARAGALPESVVKEGVPQAKRKKILAYGIAAAILAVAVGTAVIFQEPGKSGSGKEGINQTSKVKIGTPIWEFETGGNVFSAPAIGSDGTVYVGSADNKLYAINGKSGVMLWEFQMGSYVSSSPAIGSDGTVYVGSGTGMPGGGNDNKLYDIKTDSKDLAKSPWPMHGQNARHTGRAK